MASMAPVVEELPDNRVRLTVDVPREDVHHAVEHAATDLAASAKIPGFRKGRGQRDFVVELGSGRLVPELEEQLIGMSDGEAREVRFELPDEQLAVVRTVMKEVKEKVLPPLDDDLARAASEFDTLADLRAEIEGRLREQVEAQVEEGFRRSTLDALVAATNVEPAGPVVEARTRTLLRELDEMMRRRGGTLDTYLQVTGGSPEELVSRLHDEARSPVAGELVPA